MCNSNDALLKCYTHGAWNALKYSQMAMFHDCITSNGISSWKAIIRLHFWVFSLTGYSTELHDIRHSVKRSHRGCTDAKTWAVKPGSKRAEKDAERQKWRRTCEECWLLEPVREWRETSWSSQRCKEFRWKLEDQLHIETEVSERVLCSSWQMYFQAHTDWERIGCSLWFD